MRLEVVVLDDCGGVLVLEDVEGESVERLRLICIADCDGLIDTSFAIR